MRLRSSLMVVTMMASVWAVAGGVTAHTPDTSCSPHNGVGAPDTPHAYYVSNGRAEISGDGCPTTYSGELGFGLNAVTLFARDGDGVDPDGNIGGDGAADCYGVPTFGHHGSHSTIFVNDHVLGGAVAFVVARDWNRSLTNPVLPGGNENGDFDCGDTIIEPCDPESEATMLGGCNHLDAAYYVFPASGLCDGFTSMGALDPNDPSFPGRILAFATDLVVTFLGLNTPTCTVPGPNSWTAPNGGTLAEFAGADGTVVLFIEGNVRFDAGHAGTGTFGDVWTDLGFFGNSVSGGGGNPQKCEGMINVCLWKKSCTGGTVNVCPGASCSGWINVCLPMACASCDAPGRNDVGEWIGTDTEGASLEERAEGSAES